MEPLKLKIEGMSCGHCVVRVEKALSRLDGVSVRRVDIGLADLLVDPARVSFERIRQELDDAGYEARPVEPAERLA